jgi:hypothetical protein
MTMSALFIFKTRRKNEMKDFEGRIEYKGRELRLVFNLNVMQAIQEEYGTLEEWGALTDGANGEPNAKAVIFGFTQMVNEGIDMDNEDKGTDDKPMTLKQVGRMITEIGMDVATEQLNETVVESTKGDGKNE